MSGLCYGCHIGNGFYGSFYVLRFALGQSTVSLAPSQCYVMYVIKIAEILFHHIKV